MKSVILPQNPRKKIFFPIRGKTRLGPDSSKLGRPYQYRYPGTRKDYDLYSLGKDGREGADDITNWE